jgi:hypothetical protein
MKILLSHCLLIWAIVTPALANDENIRGGADATETTAAELDDTHVTANSVPEAWQDEYFGKRPAAFLTDPQRLLAPADFRERLAFLNYHAGDSGIDLYVHVFGGDQEIPAGWLVEEWIDRWFADGKPAAVVHYFHGAPQRAELWLSPSLTGRISASEQRRVLENPVVQASKEFEPARQLEAFLLQMSIRLYWLETLLNEGPSTEGTASSIPPVRRGAPVKPGLAEFLNPWLESARPFLPHVLAGVGSLLAAILATWWMKRSTRYRLPDFEAEPRLGGPHAAGVGAVISFASANVPPATQRNPMPDYLQRVR